MNDNASNTNTILIVVVIIILVAVGVWWFVGRGSAAPATNPNAASPGLNVDVNVPTDGTSNTQPANTQSGGTSPAPSGGAAY